MRDTFDILRRFQNLPTVLPLKLLLMHVRQKHLKLLQQIQKKAANVTNFLVMGKFLSNVHFFIFR